MAAKSSLPGTSRTLKRRYSDFFGRRVLEHDHRADVVGALDVAHVVALDPQRGVGQAEVVLQLVEGPGPAVVVASPGAAGGG